MKISSYLLFFFIIFNLHFIRKAQGQIVVYDQDFESNSGGWTNFEIVDEDNSWSWGTNSFAGNSTGHWKTKPFNPYPNGQILLVESPSLNFTGKSGMTFSLSLRYDTESAKDGVKIEYSIDNGVTWIILGKRNSGANWYNTNSVGAFSSNGWSGNNNSWATSTYALPNEVNNQSNVKFRFYFASDYSVTGQGVAFDNINITNTGGSVYSENFNANEGGWKNILKLPTGYWVRDNNSFTGNSTNHWHIFPHKKYAGLMNAGLTSEKYDFRTYKNLTLSFDLRYRTQANFDGMIVEYTTDSITWQALGAFGEGTLWYNTQSANFGFGFDAWSGNNQTWRTVSIPLPSHLDYTSNVYFRFRFFSDFSTQDEGVAIDNVKISIPNNVTTFITKKSGSLTDLNTWLTLLPIKNASAFIDINHVITLTNNTIIDYNLSFLKGSVLNLNGFTLTCNADLNFDVSALLIANGGRLVFAKNGDQTIGSANYYDLELAGSGIKTFNVPLKVTHELEISSSSVTLNTNDNLTLTSDASYTARLLTIPTGATVNGKLKIERFLPANQRTWWQMSSPYSDATVANYQEFFPITGAFDGTDVLDGTNNTSIYSYDETNTSSDYNIGWTAFPSANSLETFSSGTGYRIYLRKDKTTAIGDLNVSVLGTPNIGNISLPVTFTTSTVVDADGWSFVGNPYPCDIDWDAVSWTKTNIANAIYVWDAANSQYMTYINGVGTNGGSNNIASSQGFWVRAIAKDPVLTAKETVKTSNNAAFKRNSILENVLFIEISENGKSANTAIRFDKDATDDFDTQFDAEFLNSDNIVGICSHSTDLSKFYSINALPKSTIQVPFWVIHSAVKKSRTLSFSNLDGFDVDDEIYLIDKYLKDTVLLYEGFTYSFSNNNATKSNGTQRFEILRKRPSSLLSVEINKEETLEIYPTIITQGENINIYSQNRQETTVMITDLLGKVWYKQNIELNEKNTIPAPQQNGIYLVYVVMDGNEIVRKILVE